MFLMGFTPIGTIQAGVLTITLLGIPVAIIACVFGKWMGAVIGLIWGTISFIQGATGLDPAGPILMEYSTIGLVVTCFLPRILTGFLAGLIYEINKGWDKKGHINAVISSASVTFFNTLLFMTSYCLFFFSSPSVQSSISYLSDKYGVNASNPLIFIVFAVGINFLVELAVNAIVGSACVFGVNKAALSLGVTSPFSQKQEKKEKEEK
jgi:uncharacterized membrane protein